jgi:hypothetical protein
MRNNGLILASCAGAVLLGTLAVTLGDGPKVEAPSEAKSVDQATTFLRIRRDDDKQPVALETAVTHYVSKPGRDQSIQVDLIGAVHVGEHQYYEQLNELFKTYDVVLYELVAPEGTRVVPGQQRAGGNPVSFLQNIMKDVLKLEFQLDSIDYTRPNFVHADMSPQEFSQSMKERGESFLTLFLRVMADSMAAQAKRGNERPNADIELLVALLAKDRSYRLKRLMAEQFESMEDQMSSLSGPKGSTLITQRNKKALDVLRDQIEHGRRRLAIFYGAGHLSDMERRLVSDFGLRKESQRWLVAWSITRASVESQSPELQPSKDSDAPAAVPAAK